MGISTSAKLIYGAEYDELSELEDLEQKLDDGELDYASPYYDSPREEWIVGIELRREYDGEAEILEAIRDARVRFEKTTDGMPGRIIASPHVC